MEASMCGFGSEAAMLRPGIRTARRKHSIVADRCARERMQAPDWRKPRECRPTRRVEHALFALILGCVGYVWLGALLAEAVQAL